MGDNPGHSTTGLLSSVVFMRRQGLTIEHEKIITRLCKEDVLVITLGTPDGHDPMVVRAF